MQESTYFDPKKLDLVMRDEDFVIYYDANPLTTPNGGEFAHKDARILKHILVKLTLRSQNQMNALNSISAFTFLKDQIESGHDFIAENFDLLFDEDFIIKTKFGEKTQRFIDMAQILDYIEKNQEVMNLMFWGVSVIMEGFREYMTGFDMDAADRKDPQKLESVFKEAVQKSYGELSPEKRAAIGLLSLHHHNGLMLPIMLVQQIISPSEYANSTLAIHTNYNPASLVSDKGYHDFGFDIKPVIVDWEKPLEAIARVHDEALKTLEFLSFYNPGRSKISVITELISQGENDTLEFKSTFRWDIRQNKKNPAIEHASLKTMAAFMNLEGGDLLIGVEDDGNILGVELDKFPNDDKFLLHLWSLIKTSMGQDVSPYLTTTLEKFGDKTVCRVHCKPSPKPIFLRQKGFDESFYIRMGPSTGSLEISEALKYIGEHFVN